jgi:hypothetical protein
MTHPQVNVEGLQPGDRVQVEARGHVMATRDSGSNREVLVHLRDGDFRADVWLPVGMLVLLDGRATP